jgi:hypothetical protein
MDEETKKRVALNEATFRSINEGVRGERADGRLSFLCECGRLGCNRLIALTRPEYEAVRGHARRFAIVPGHEIPEAESVVERHRGYAVVEKHPGTADIAEQTDPRRALDA